MVSDTVCPAGFLNGDVIASVHHNHFKPLFLFPGSLFSCPDHLLHQGLRETGQLPVQGPGWFQQ